ncbi:hypothetical protein MMG85_06760 [Pseudoxanthomonas sp. LH2527]|uniref:glutaredoxin family protein n=1 Tax=Pseudoxanthomonas sp. LH2527 TaxID=2923249 RepID=UPI001F137C6C|nr:glutaredoxin domain-containing protein [Pseudoxanthomonas sp. LH2527]MCH6483266.1 hypothetical protein [Pseudoxanthomonas sp. LH2527]
MSRTFLVLVSILVVLGAGHHAYKHIKAKLQSSMTETAIVASSRNTVVVYGRDGCGYTRQMLASLQGRNIPVTYVDIDRPGASQAFHDRFDGSGLADHRGYALPVVEVDGEVHARPSPDVVAYHFQTRD